MSAQKAAILGKITAALAERGQAASDSSPEARISAHAANLVPLRGRLRGAEAIAQFAQRLTKNFATVNFVATVQDIPLAVAEYLRVQNLTGPVRISQQTMLAALPWDLTGAEIRTNGLAEEDTVGISVALCGIAETGTLMLHSGSDAASGLNFLPPTHIVVVQASTIVGALEDAWGRLRAATNGQMPRTVNLISGPSRTADIGMTMIMGAHGPKRLHVIVIQDVPQ